MKNLILLICYVFTCVSITSSASSEEILRKSTPPPLNNHPPQQPHHQPQQSQQPHHQQPQQSQQPHHQQPQQSQQPSPQQPINAPAVPISQPPARNVPTFQQDHHYDHLDNSAFKQTVNNKNHFHDRYHRQWDYQKHYDYHYKSNKLHNLYPSKLYYCTQDENGKTDFKHVNSLSIAKQNQYECNEKGIEVLAEYSDNLGKSYSEFLYLTEGSGCGIKIEQEYTDYCPRIKK